jgi:hypothetical protein
MEENAFARLEWFGIEEVGFGLTGINLNGGNWFWPACKGLEMGKIGFGLPGTVWNRVKQFWPDWNGLERRKSVFACLE